MYPKEKKKDFIKQNIQLLGKQAKTFNQNKKNYGMENADNIVDESLIDQKSFIKSPTSTYTVPNYLA